MQTDIGLTDKQWNLCLTIFFFPYAALEVPSNIVLKVLEPNIWLSILVVSWGLVVVMTGIVHNYSGLLTVRFFLGVTEVRCPFAPFRILLTACIRPVSSQPQRIFLLVGTNGTNFSREWQSSTRLGQWQVPFRAYLPTVSTTWAVLQVLRAGVGKCQASSVACLQWAPPKSQFSC